MAIQSPIEEKWNWLTHGLGIVLSLIGFFVLIANDTKLTVYSTHTIILYSVSLFALYFASTAYHYSSNPILKRKFRAFDHISIYLLIAGTYSPVTLITLINSNGWLLFFLVWSIAGLGTILKLFFTGRFEIFSVLLYLIMGWLIVLDINSLSDKVGDKGMLLLMLGGAAYTLGIIFYALRKMKFHHVIWHLFVLAGSIFHYVFILRYII
ncbi:PAQR family membrane homeostasis protein TrhA [Aquimarina sp. 2201CG5-10]|uniref:PAQR family membrane homeostasis protein TrhA n=1 Tax=Aquimarina callyspongiae TaxID=3098150 RepID=UPI002AB46149|nr:hemolysin III family protein [Aquimarina sp. 2201CG5-10]MDY8138958.1 hemolysin III family protein [Aquimarina sp. 2201CG5-10]